MIVTNANEARPRSLRERKRLAAMKRVQTEAVARFTADGFDHVTVEEIAAAVEVSAMSVYRWFGTKEALVLWDEFDPPILAELSVRLARQPALPAVRDTMVALLDDVYDRERALALDRAQLIFREPALAAAAEQDSRKLRDAFSDLFVTRGGLKEFEARVSAAVASALLTAAIDEWQRHDGTRPLAELITCSFAVLEGDR
jgi:AcrR family transcriptional regulator